MLRKINYIVFIYVNSVCVEKKYFRHEHRLLNALRILTKYYEEIYVEDKAGNKWKAENFISQMEATNEHGSQ